MVTQGQDHGLETAVQLRLEVLLPQIDSDRESLSLVERLAQEFRHEPQDPVVHEEFVELHGQRRLAFVLLVFNFELSEGDDLADVVLEAVLRQQLVEMRQRVFVIGSNPLFQVFDDEAHIGRDGKRRMGQFPKKKPINQEKGNRRRSLTFLSIVSAHLWEV